MRRIGGISFIPTFLILFAASCSSETPTFDLINQFPVPERAFDVKKLELSGSTHQLYFKIKEAYPSTAVMNFYREHMEKNDWKACDTNNNKWESYEDRSNKIHLLVHRTSDYWIKPTQRKLLNLSALYYSLKLTGKLPDNDDQIVLVWVMQAKDLKSEVSNLQLRCPVNSSS